MTHKLASFMWHWKFVSANVISATLKVCVSKCHLCNAESSCFLMSLNKTKMMHYPGKFAKSSYGELHKLNLNSKPESENLKNLKIWTANMHQKFITINYIIKAPIKLKRLNCSFFWLFSYWYTVHSSYLHRLGNY